MSRWIPFINQIWIFFNPSWHQFCIIIFIIYCICILHMHLNQFSVSFPIHLNWIFEKMSPTTQFQRFKWNSPYNYICVFFKFKMAVINYIYARYTHGMIKFARDDSTICYGFSIKAPSRALILWTVTLKYSHLCQSCIYDQLEVSILPVWCIIQLWWQYLKRHWPVLWCHNAIMTKSDIKSGVNGWPLMLSAYLFLSVYMFSSNLLSSKFCSFHVWEVILSITIYTSLSHVHK